MTEDTATESAKMLAAVLHGMQGTPYIYQGEELGMTNVVFPDIRDYRDVETSNMYYERLEAGYEREDVMRSIYAKSRDNARTPMQWSGGNECRVYSGHAVDLCQSQLYADQRRSRDGKSRFRIPFL